MLEGEESIIRNLEEAISPKVMGGRSKCRALSALVIVRRLSDFTITPFDLSYLVTVGSRVYCKAQPAPGLHLSGQVKIHRQFWLLIVGTSMVFIFLSNSTFPKLLTHPTFISIFVSLHTTIYLCIPFLFPNILNPS